jgi:hypothetical protein
MKFRLRFTAVRASILAAPFLRFLEWLDIPLGGFRRLSTVPPPFRGKLSISLLYCDFKAFKMASESPCRRQKQMHRKSARPLSNSRDAKRRSLGNENVHFLIFVDGKEVMQSFLKFLAFYTSLSLIFMIGYYKHALV